MKKIRKTMRREDGFTLVELLAVIVILGIILAIAIPAIGGVIGRAEDQADKASQDLAIDAARLYVVGGEVADWEDNKAEISVDILYSKGYLEEPSGDDATKLTGSVKVTRTAIDDSSKAFKYKYEYTAVTP